MRESQIRDILIQNLHILNPNYRFLVKEAYLTSEIGTRSFIDILARDDNGKYIIIELKKSNTVARQAIHELFKYLEALKENLSVKSDEIELVIVSTEWDELLVPFSSFVSNTNLKTLGFQLYLENNEISAKEISTNVTNEDRILSAVQMANYYSSYNSLEEGLKENINFFSQRDIENFVLLILKAPEDYNEMVLESIHNFEIEMYGKAKTKIYSLPKFEYMIYRANQLLSIEKYKTICSKYYTNPEVKDHVEEILDDDEMSSYDKMEEFNRLVLDQHPFPKSDYSEIGTPAKYTKFIEDEGWELIEIKKFGSLSENLMLTNDIIEQELKASGTTHERYIAEIDVTNKANVVRVKKEISNCLSDNIVWRNHILEILDLLINEKDNIKKIRCSIYNPMNIIYSIYLICSYDSGVLYIPSYQIEVELEDEFRMYIGYLDGNFKNVTMPEILAEFWNSNKLEFLIALNWGGYTKYNLEVCEFIGLTYKTMLIKKNKEELKFFRYENYKFIKSEYFNHIENILKKISDNTVLVSEINSFFNSHSLGNGLWEI
jgi:Endonuclease NucS